jgi:hypothetical protein
MAEPLGFENLVAPKETVCIGPQALEEVLARRQLIPTRPQTGSDGTRLGTARRRELEPQLGPRKETRHMHKASVGAHGGRRHTRQEGVLELTRNPPAGRHKPLKGGVVLLLAPEPPRGRVCDIVDARAC